MKKPGVFDSLARAAGEKRAGARGRVVFWLSIALAALFLFLAVRDLSWSSFFDTLQKARYIFLPVLFIWGALSLLVRAARWRVLIGYEKEVPCRNVFFANAAGYLGNNIFPARAGELVRAAYLGTENNISVSFVLATGIVERIMDLIALVILGAFSLALAGPVSGPLQTGLFFMSALGCVGLASIFTLPCFNIQLASLVKRFPVNDNLKARLENFLNQFLDGLQSLRNPARAARFLLYTSLVWLMDGLGMVFAARILNLNLPIQQAMLLLSGLGLSSAIPSTPGYVGVYQFMAAQILGPFGFSNADSVALVLFAQISNFLVILFWGLIAMGRFTKKTPIPAETKE
ncbi:MAG: hypothetical protein HFACDABA_02066 [Anaerolineales bacterium]|nr:hypothetical protein [Anaerolineales bacterium]